MSSNITFKRWLQSHITGGTCCFKNPWPFFTALYWDTFGTDLLFEVRMKQTTMIEIHFLSSKKKKPGLPLQCLPYSPLLSFKHSSSRPPDELRDMLVPIFCRLCRAYFDASLGSHATSHRLPGPRCSRQGSEELLKCVQHCIKGKLLSSPQSKTF